MNQKYFKYVHTLFVVLPMSMIMAFVGIIRHHGLNEGWGSKFFYSWVIMLPIAYLAALAIIPPAKKLAERVASE